MLEISFTKLFALLLVGLQLRASNAFLFNKNGRVINSKLMMGGGRSLAEKDMTNRQLFHQLREKMIDASKRPGWINSSKEIKEVELYLKSNRDGTQIGDCPYGQFVQLVMLKKGISYDIKPTSPNNKPDWLVEKHKGKLPAIVHKGKVVTDSLGIAEYLEKAFPLNSLTRQGAYSYQEVLEKTSGFFPAVSAFIKNKDEAKDAELLAEVEKNLDILDELLRSTPGQFLCGLELTLADLYLLPQLFHAVVAMDHFKEYEFYHIEGDFVRPALESYVSRMFDMEEFNNKKAYYNVDQVVYGWKVARGEAN